MTPGRVYLDANASERLRPAARAAMLAVLEETGNPASQHAEGRRARQVLERARVVIGGRFGAAPEDVVFTSGGTEANALAIGGHPGRRVLVGATEHPAVLQAAPEAVRLPVDPAGRLRLEDLAAALADGPPALVCAMHANHETGVLHPMAAIAALCRDHGALLHVDAVQSAGRLPVSLAELGADSLAVSSHKLGGPAGAGALVMRPALGVRAIMPGGGQELGRRGGTPALGAIAGFAAAAACAPEPGRLAALRDTLEAAARARGAVVVGAEAARLPNTACLARPGRAAATQVIALDLAGVAVSAGAACSSGKIGRSAVLEAMGLPALAGCAIRVSLGWDTSEADVAAFSRVY